MYQPHRQNQLAGQLGTYSPGKPKTIIQDQGTRCIHLEDQVYNSHKLGHHDTALRKPGHIFGQCREDCLRHIRLAEKSKAQWMGRIGTIPEIPPQPLGLVHTKYAK